MEHSKLPWEAVNEDDKCGYEKERPDCLSIKSEDNWYIARIWLHPLGWLPQAKANAEFITKACNEHDGLKAKADGLELENIALRGAESAALQELNEALMLLRSSYKGYRLSSEDHFRITELIKELP